MKCRYKSIFLVYNIITEGEVKKMSEEILKQILQEIKEIKAEIGDMKVDITDMKVDITGIKADQVTMKSQIAENTQLLKAVIHRQDEFDAKMDGLTLDVAKIHGEVSTLNNTVSEIRENQTSIHQMLGEHEVTIRSLVRRPV